MMDKYLHKYYVFELFPSARHFVKESISFTFCDDGEASSYRNVCEHAFMAYEQNVLSFGSKRRAS